MKLNGKKQWIGLFLTVIVIVAWVGVGLGVSAEIPKPGPAPGEKWPATLVLEGGGAGSSSYIVVAAVGDAIKKDLGIVAQVKGGTPVPQVARLVHKGESDIGMITSSVCYMAFQGLSAFKDNPATNLRAITYVTCSAEHFITWKNKGINSGADLKGKTVMGVNEGTAPGMDPIFGVLAANGLTPNDLKIKSFLGFNQQFDFLNLRMGDAILMESGVATAPLIESDRTQNLKFLSFTDKEIAAITKVPYWSPFTLPAGTYANGQPQALRTVAMAVAYFANINLPDSLVYQIEKILYDKPGRFVGAHKEWGQFDLAKAATVRAAPYHAGAVKYFKERGLWDAAADKWQSETLKKVGATK